MALPIILFNSSTGSDSAASGAGPSTALTGSAASTDGTGLVVTLDGSPSLTVVAVDGSHVIYLADSTAGNRNFGKITAKDDTAKTVTVANAFGLSLSGKAWAIGGKRLSLAATSSAKLRINNFGAGDALAGWTLQMESGYTETLAGTLAFARAGSATVGRICLRSDPAAGTPAVLTFSNNGVAIDIQSAWVGLDSFELQNTNATKTASIAVQMNQNQSNLLIRNLKIAHSTNKFWKGVAADGLNHLIESNHIAYCANVGYQMGHSFSGGSNHSLINNHIHDCVSHGISQVTGSTGWRLRKNIIANNGGDGFNCSFAPVSGFVLTSNTFANNAGDGIEFTATPASIINSEIENNVFSGNGGYGENWSNGASDDATLSTVIPQHHNNVFYNNTSGATLPTTISAMTGTSTANPAFTNAGSGDYSVGTAMKAIGYPTTKVGGYSGTTQSYVDPGAAQRQEVSGGLVQARSMSGGFSQ